MINRNRGFSEAYKRFKEKVDMSSLDNFEQLAFAFAKWGGKRAPLTKIQIRALKRQAQKDGFKVDIKKSTDKLIEAIYGEIEGL